MKEISNFFLKFKGIALKELKKKEGIQNTIKKIIKQDIDIKDITFKEGVIIIKGNQAFKSEIFLKKKQILDSIFTITGIQYHNIK
jgi:hypothetical protein